MKAFFSRVVPFYFIEGKEMSDDQGFDAYPVEVEPKVLANARSARRLVAKMESLFLENSAPEEAAQAEADICADEIKRIFKTKAQHNG